MSFDPELMTETTGASAPDSPASVASRPTPADYASGTAARSVHGHDHEGHDHAGHDHSPEPEPSPQPTPDAAALPGDVVPDDLDAERPVGAAVPDAIVNRIMEELRRSPRMATVLQEIETYGGGDFDIVWIAGGSNHLDGRIRLDRRKTIGSLVSSMFHELNHLNDFRQGRQADKDREGRDEFVASKVGNEMRAQAIAYVAYLEHRDADGHMRLGYSPKGMSQFLTHLRAQSGHESFDSAAIEGVAMAWLESEYRNNPLFITGTTGENYYDYWGRIWDAAHESE